MDLLSRLSSVGDAVVTLAKAGFLTPMRPDRTVAMVAAARAEGLSIATGFATAAARRPDSPGLIDELGTLTWRELDQRAHALAAALQQLPDGAARSDVAGPAAPAVVGIMARNHRGFVESLIAATRIGADVLLLNTSFAGPALAEVVERERADVVIYDEEFTPSVDRALQDRPQAARILAWTDTETTAPTVEKLIAAHAGQKAAKSERKSRLILLTSGTTGTPKGAKHSGGGASNLVAILSRTPWRLGETTVVVAPMFHAWGFAGFTLTAARAGTVVTRRKFDPEKTLAMVAEHRATILHLVPVMLERIMGLAPDVRRQYDCSSLRAVTLSGSAVRSDAVTSFMDEYGDLVYNSYSSTEVGWASVATPADLRAAPTTAGRPLATTVSIPSCQARYPPRMRTTTRSAASSSSASSPSISRAGLAHRNSAPLARAVIRSVSDVDSNNTVGGTHHSYRTAGAAPYSDRG